MGVDIDGIVEVRRWASWTAAVHLDCLYDTRSYDAFGCLFGVMNYAGFRPVAANRGLPSDASEHTRQALPDAEHDGLWPTWIGWHEIQQIDWNEPAEQADARLHRYERDGAGHWVYRGKAGWNREVFEIQGVPPPPADTWPEVWPEGSVWTKGDVQYRAERLIRRDAIPEHSDWRPVWEVMAVLARRHGDENCRLVVWFDR